MPGLCDVLGRGQRCVGAPQDGVARPMKKHNTGSYVKGRSELDPSKVSELVNRYHLVEEVFRVQILAVDERREAKLAEERAARAERQARKDAAQAAAAASAETEETPEEA